MLSRINLYAAISLIACLAVVAPTYAIQSVDDPTAGEIAINKRVGHDCRIIRLWPDGGVPDQKATTEPENVTDKWKDRTGQVILKNITRPSLILLPAKRDINTGSLVVLCPGGGYNSLFCGTVIETAEWLNGHGINVAILKYRVPRSQGPTKQRTAVQDAQRAMGILRGLADELHIDPNKIGIGGYSAGGHLVAALSINHRKRAYTHVDDTDKISCRPDFSVLLYPAYLTDPIESQVPDKTLNTDLISNEITPPTFIAVTNPDKFATGSLQHYLQLAGGKISTELHVYPTGAHGGGVLEYPFNEWKGECLRFMQDHGFAKSGERPKPHTYKAKDLPAVEPSTELTLGDQRLRQIFGKGLPIVPVWPADAPGEQNGADHTETVTAKSRGGVALNIRDVVKPTLIISQPTVSGKTNPNAGRTVIVCPGGAYNGLAAEHEGVKICQWLNGMGITAALLKYRVPRPKTGPKHQRAIQDLQRSIRLLRANADRFKINVNDIGVCGFSAGGHLCTTLATNYTKNSYPPFDEIDKQSARPDFAILIYPAYLTEPAASNTVDPQLLNLNQQTPPLFLASARDDRFTHGMVNFFVKLHQSEVSAEMHVYSKGGHGGGLDPGSYPTSQWTTACERWLKDVAKSANKAKAE